MVSALHRSSGSYELVIGAVAAALVGLGIDALLGTRPIFTVLFALAGFVGATFSIWLQYTMSMEAESGRRRDRAEAAQDPQDPQHAGSRS